MRIRPDGSVQSSTTPTLQNLGAQEDNSLYRCMVTKVIYVDDAQNITTNATNPRVLYEVVVLGGFASGQVIGNCRLASILGGNFNYYERTLRPASKNVSKSSLSTNDGDIVYVQYVQGNRGAPVIVGLDQGISTGTAVGAKTANGQIEHHQYNGIESLIDASGNFTWIRHGGKTDKTLSAFVPDKTEDVKFNVGPGKVTLTFKSGVTMTIDGTGDQITLATKGGAQVSIDGATDTILLKTKGSGELKLSAGKVALGSSTAELLDQISKQLEKLNTVFSAVASHTHIGNLGYPTAPPSTAGAWTTAASDMNTIKAKIDAIKGTL